MHKNNESKLDEFISEVNVRFSSRKWINKDTGFYQCESEIEKYFLTGFFYRCLFDELNHNAKTLINDSRLNLSVEKIVNGFYNYLLTDVLLDHSQVSFIFPQYQIDNFRVDFLLMVLYKDQDNIIVSPKLVVECDGFEFHDKTADLINKDKLRDEYLINKGFSVLRFSGKQLHHNPFECALYTENLLKNSSIIVYKDPKMLFSETYRSFKNNISIREIENLRIEEQEKLLIQKQIQEDFKNNPEKYKVQDLELSEIDLKYRSKQSELKEEIEELRNRVSYEMSIGNKELAKELLFKRTELIQEQMKLKENYFNGKYS